jgi:hypothetical protein
VPNVSNERVNLLFGEFLAVTRHLALAIHDRIEDSFVAHSVLPFGVSEVARVASSSASSPARTVPAMTRRTLFIVRRGCAYLDEAGFVSSARNEGCKGYEKTNQ